MISAQNFMTDTYYKVLKKISRYWNRLLIFPALRTVDCYGPWLKAYAF